MYADYWEAHETEYEAMTEWLAFEADMATNPWGEYEPNIKAMAAAEGWN